MNKPALPIDDAARWLAWRDRGCLKSRAQLIEQHRGLVGWIIANRLRFRGRWPDDLYQAGLVGLIAAIDRFDPARGAPFPSFAIPYVMAELCDALRGDRGAEESWDPADLDRLRDRPDDGCAVEASCIAQAERERLNAALTEALGALPPREQWLLRRALLRGEAPSQLYPRLRITRSLAFRLQRQGRARLRQSAPLRALLAGECSPPAIPAASV